MSNRDHSLVALRATKQCVIGIPSVELAEKVVAISNCSGRDVDKFAAFLPTPKKALSVSAPLIAECFANIECSVVDTRFVNKYCLFVLDLKAWVNPLNKNPQTIHRQGFGRFIVDGDTIELTAQTP